MNELQYTVTLEDLVQFTEYEFEHSPSLQSIDRNARFGVAVFLWVVGLIQLALTRNVPVFLVWVALICALALIWPVWQRHSLRKRAMQLYGEEGGHSHLGDMRLRLEPGVLVMVSEVSETKRKWEGVERIEETSDYVFIHLSSISAVVIPKHRITAGDCDEFVGEVRQRLQTTAAQQVAAADRPIENPP